MVSTLKNHMMIKDREESSCTIALWRLKTVRRVVFTRGSAEWHSVWPPITNHHIVFAAVTSVITCRMKMHSGEKTEMRVVLTRGSSEWHSVWPPSLPHLLPIFTYKHYSLKCSAVKCAHCTAADIVCGPEFHISGICLHRRYTQACLLLPTTQPSFSTWHWSKNIWLLRNSSKKQLQCCQICCQPILLVLAQGSDFSACCIIFHASSSPFFALFSNHPVHSFVHRFQRSGRNTRSG